MKDLLIKLIRSQLCEIAPDQLLSREERASLEDPEVLSGLYSLALPHDLQHIVGQALYRVGAGKEDQTAPLYREAQMLAAYRYEGRAYALSELASFFAQIETPYIPLKGALISRYYPSPEMRTSCDIDILIKREDLEKVSRDLTERLSYTKHKEGGHDVQFVSPLGVHLELHFTLAEKKDTSPAADMLRRVWDIVTPSENDPFRMEMPLDFAYFYHIAHMAKHFLYGGCGIRTIMDIMIFRDRIEGFDPEAAQLLIDAGGFTAFEKAMLQLCRQWFSDSSPDFDDKQTLCQAEEFIFNGGIYGSGANRVKMNRAESKNQLAYFMSRIFSPYDHIKYDYPILQKHPVLLPFCQVHRWLHLFDRKTSKRISEELKVNRGITEEGQNSTREMLKNLGLSK